MIPSCLFFNNPGYIGSKRKKAAGIFASGLYIAQAVGDFLL
jgi:hypothetical protein